MSSPPPYPGNPQDPHAQGGHPEQPTHRYGYPDRPPAHDPGVAAYGGPPPRPRNGVGTTALVLGILGILTCWLLIGALFGLIAVALGIIGIARVSKGIATNRGVAISGLVLGVLSVLATVALVVFAWGVFSSVGGLDFIDCVQRSGGDQAAVQQCQTGFQERLQQESEQLGG
ncbi:DUF4190 domain-containing protein [Pseudonocardia sp. C8]|uniref:DUF4190 domain-containing protein n=1 Tax=Pseudonocardia sp. C8 TaxID=2762759 RepID=UPI0016434C22|nr:DUF4190 domain-containing protein [Pseudonocardia sp. C8]MBC3192427.1 DUF4190 domain-containing protein [Pseudonocardia sp. C8]